MPDSFPKSGVRAYANKEHCTIIIVRISRGIVLHQFIVGSDARIRHAYFNLHLSCPPSIKPIYCHGKKIHNTSKGVRLRHYVVRVAFSGAQQHQQAPKYISYQGIWLHYKGPVPPQGLPNT